MDLLQKTNPADKLGDHYADNAGPPTACRKAVLKIELQRDDWKTKLW